MTPKLLPLPANDNRTDPSVCDCRHETARAFEMALDSLGVTRAEAARRMGVNERTVGRWVLDHQAVSLVSVCQDPALAAVYLRHLSELIGSEHGLDQVA